MRPLSLSAAIFAVLLIVYEVIQIASGHLYQKVLDKMDATTLVELGILTLLGVYTLRDQTDLHAVSFTLVAGLSFIFIPFRVQYPAACGGRKGSGLAPRLIPFI